MLLYQVYFILPWLNLHIFLWPDFIDFSDQIRDTATDFSFYDRGSVLTPTIVDSSSVHNGESSSKVQEHDIPTKVEPKVDKEPKQNKVDQNWDRSISRQGSQVSEMPVWGEDVVSYRKRQMSTSSRSDSDISFISETLSKRLL